MKPIALASLALVLTGCAATDTGPSPYEGQWRIGQLNGEALMPTPGPAKPTLTVTGEQLSTSFGCNQVNGAWPAQGQPFGPQMSTRMACPAPVAKMEQDYGALMASADGYRIEHGRLQILSGGQVVLQAYRDVPGSQFAAWSGQWSLAKIDGIDSIQGLYDGRPPYLVLEMEEGRANGNSGCNQFFASVVPAGDALWLQQAGMTLVACPDNLARQEQVMMQHFAEADRTVEQDGKLQWWKGETLLLEFERQ
ncbi:META domain-containing protein [Ferrimonas balearica]|uniref:META domain-containing protein n=1 Tax=Ferrimonas balearica TaxID=44012 RepID=UPI001C994CFE|nr:META domain-containing protein [Ferrimonas balearica]MBY5990854.1 META domain-containing protein [Ferrimonas balearica]